MPTSASFAFGGDSQLTLTHKGIRGEGRIYPRAVITFEARHHLMGGRAEPKEIEIQRLIADLRCGNEMIGRGEVREYGSVISIHSDGHLEVEVPLSPAAIRYVDETARRTKVNLRIVVRIAFRYRKPARVATTGTLEESPSAWEAISNVGAPAVDIEVPRSAWVNEVLQPVGTLSYICMELPIPPLPAAGLWPKALEHLSRAEARDHEGADPDVLRSCHDALAALSPSNPKAIVPAMADEAKREKLDAVLQAFRSFLQSGRHPQPSRTQAGGYDVDHRDALFALAMTKVWLTYLARQQSSS